MSTRVRKQIGYFLDIEKINSVLVDNYEDILSEENAINKSNIAKYWELWKQEYPKNNVYNYQIKEFLKDPKIDSINIFVNEILHLDNFKGILLLTPKFKEATRHNNLIDSYENNEMNFICKKIYEPIYPEMSYVCVKEPLLTADSLEYLEEYCDLKGIKVGEAYTPDILHSLGIQNEIHKEPLELSYPKGDGIKYFHPYINPLVYFILQDAELLKKDISYLDFIIHVEPAIITSWG